MVSVGELPRLRFYKRRSRSRGHSAGGKGNIAPAQTGYGAGDFNTATPIPPPEKRCERDSDGRRRRHCPRANGRVARWRVEEPETVSAGTLRLPADGQQKPKEWRRRGELEF